MNITLTNTQIFAYAMGLKEFQEISDTKLPMEVNWKVGLNFDKLVPYAQKYEEEFRRIIETHGIQTSDDKGNPMYVPTEESRRLAAELDSIEISVEIQSIKYSLFEEKGLELAPKYFAAIRFMVTE